MIQSKMLYHLYLAISICVAIAFFTLTKLCSLSAILSTNDVVKL